MVAAIASAGVAAGAALFLLDYNSKYLGKTNNGDEKCEKIELLDIESSNLMAIVPAVSTVTFYEGNVDSIESYLSERLTTIVMLNRCVENSR